jgi:hypothetical protein
MREEDKEEDIVDERKTKKRTLEMRESKTKKRTLEREEDKEEEMREEDKAEDIGDERDKEENPLTKQEGIKKLPPTMYFNEGIMSPRISVFNFCVHMLDT